MLLLCKCQKLLWVVYLVSDLHVIVKSLCQMSFFFDGSTPLNTSYWNGKVHSNWIVQLTVTCKTNERNKPFSIKHEASAVFILPKVAYIWTNDTLVPGLIATYVYRFQYKHSYKCIIIVDVCKCSWRHSIGMQDKTSPCYQCKQSECSMFIPSYYLGH